MPIPTKTSKTTVKKKSFSQIAKERGFRSGLEGLNAEHLEAHGIKVVYEDPASKIKYRVDKECTYTPDFILPNGIIIETKGRFTTEDRQKHLRIKAQHPDKDIRFVFERSSTRISKTSTTTYAAWSRKNGFLFADKKIPLEWIKETNSVEVQTAPK
jgi:hypothetical protein